MFGSPNSQPPRRPASLSSGKRVDIGANHDCEGSSLTRTHAPAQLPRVIALGCALVFSGCTLWFGAYDGTPRTAYDLIDEFDGGVPIAPEDAGASGDDAGLPVEDAGEPTQDAGQPTPDAGGSGMRDQDSDGIRDDIDNCPELANADQMDRDSDTQGDACDPNPDVPDLVLSGQSLVISERSSDSEFILDADISISSVESSDGEFFLMGTLQP